MDKGLILVLDFPRTLRELYVSAIPDTEMTQVIKVFIPVASFAKEVNPRLANAHWQPMGV